MSTQRILGQLMSILDRAALINSQAARIDAHLFGERPSAGLSEIKDHGSGFIGEVSTILDQISNVINNSSDMLQGTIDRLDPQPTGKSAPDLTNFLVGTRPAPPSRPPLRKADMSELLTEDDMREVMSPPPSKPSPGAF